MRALTWGPVAAVTLVHLIALALGAGAAAAWSQVLLMPALAVVLLGLPSDDRGPAWPWALGALAASWVGDSLPRVLPADARFLAMVGGFAVAQGLWIVAFTRVDRGRSPFAWTLLLIVVAVALLMVTVPEAGLLAPAVVVYGLLLLTVAWLASSHGWVGALGAALFVVSDGLIALGAFRPELVDWANRDLMVMATYVGAQALFVIVILLTRSPDRAFGRAPRRGTRVRSSRGRHPR
ncbi:MULTISPECIES: lysoplasmalogenase [unclassified Dietzia]|uniref:lysoplasmalogenase n=1 Tax=unclassified Dietzia TaxID=2617939 RepID=UPI0012E77DC3|nr:MULTISPECIES: lysoplasmalogenase [unclassified Dietzia]